MRTIGKKLILLGVAVVMFALPATASASPQLFDFEAPLAKGAQLIATSYNTLTTNTPLGTIECASWTINITLDTNNGTEIEGHGTSAEATCFSNKEGTKVPVEVTNPTLVSILTDGEDKGTLTLTFIQDIGPFECHVEGTGDFEYATSNDVLSIPGVELASDEICAPEAGKTLFEGDYTVTTEDGTPITVE